MSSNPSPHPFWRFIFLLSAFLNCSYAWFFHFAKNPATSASVLLGMAPSGPQAVLNLLHMHVHPHALEYLKKNFFALPVASSLSPTFCENYMMVLYAFVGLAGLFYLYQGLTLKLSKFTVMIFALLKLGTAVSLWGIYYGSREPGILTWPVAFSDFTLGLAFIAWCIMEQPAGAVRVKVD
jgi:hypothetical protein